MWAVMLISASLPSVSLKLGHLEEAADIRSGDPVLLEGEVEAGEAELEAAAERRLDHRRRGIVGIDRPQADGARDAAGAGQEVFGVDLRGRAAGVLVEEGRQRDGRLGDEDADEVGRPAVEVGFGNVFVAGEVELGLLDRDLEAGIADLGRRQRRFELVAVAKTAFGAEAEAGAAGGENQQRFFGRVGIRVAAAVERHQSVARELDRRRELQGRGDFGNRGASSGGR